MNKQPLRITETLPEKKIVIKKFAFSCDDIDENMYWNTELTRVANLSHLEEIEEAEYKILDRRLK